MWRGYLLEVYYDTRWLTGLWPTQAKVEGIAQKAAWRWGSYSSVVKEPGGTPLYVGLPPAWGSVDGDRMFTPLSWKRSLYGDFDG